jgi:6,7-dimethyl-8-ribityllumazine synthase
MLQINPNQTQLKKIEQLIQKAPEYNQKLGANQIIIIRSCFNQSLEQSLEDHAQRFFQAINYPVAVHQITGAMELPWLAQEVYLKQKPSVILALGTIIKGESHHFEMVCQQSLSGLMQISLKHHVPIIQGILTTYTLKQCQQRLFLAYEQALQAYELACRLKEIPLSFA